MFTVPLLLECPLILAPRNRKNGGAVINPAVMDDFETRMIQRIRMGACRNVIGTSVAKGDSIQFKFIFKVEK